MTWTPNEAVLGALLSGAALAGAGPLASTDFYRPAHAADLRGGLSRSTAAGGPATRSRWAMSFASARAGSPRWAARRTCITCMASVPGTC